MTEKGVCSMVLLAIAATALSAEPGPAEQFHNLLHESWEFDLREDPLLATQAGDKRYNHLLPRDRPEDHVRRLEQARQFLRRLRDIDRGQLSADDQVHYDIYAWTQETAIAEGEFQTYLMPITNRSGFHVSFADLPRDVPLRTVQDYEDYIARLRAFSQYADDNIALLREGIRQGLVLPEVVLRGVDEAVKAHLVDDARQSLLYEPLTQLPTGITQSQGEALRRAGGEAIMTAVVPGYRRFYEFLRNEYLPRCRDSIGASALPRGREFYRYRVRRFTTQDVTPEEVHAIGLSEVARIRGEMEQILRKVNFQGDVKAFCDHLRREPRFFVTTPEALLKETALVLKKMDGELPKLFKTLPRTPYGIRPIPAFIAPKTTSAYYSPPAGDGSRAGYYYVNTYDLASRPLYEVEALSLHEAVPGHHLQIALQQELTNLPNFRRFASITAFVEGWALYAERLGLETGFYQDPYSDFGRLTYEMWRACRLVVDTGIHYQGWSRERAIEFMADNSALARHNIVTEVDRYISWPGQALAYKMGELKIRQLRQQAEQALGPQFDVREFHDVVLGSGAVPLSVLEANVQRYIKRHGASR